MVTQWNLSYHTVCWFGRLILFWCHHILAVSWLSFWVHCDTLYRPLFILFLLLLHPSGLWLPVAALLRSSWPCVWPSTRALWAAWRRTACGHTATPLRWSPRRWLRTPAWTPSPLWRSSATGTLRETRWPASMSARSVLLLLCHCMLMFRREHRKVNYRRSISAETISWSVVEIIYVI